MRAVYSKGREDNRHLVVNTTRGKNHLVLTSNCHTHSSLLFYFRASIVFFATSTLRPIPAPRPQYQVSKAVKVVRIYASQFAPSTEGQELLTHHIRRVPSHSMPWYELRRSTTSCQCSCVFLPCILIYVHTQGASLYQPLYLRTRNVAARTAAALPAHSRSTCGFKSHSATCSSSWRHFRSVALLRTSSRLEN